MPGKSDCLVDAGGSWGFGVELVDLKLDYRVIQQFQQFQVVCDRMDGTGGDTMS